MTGPVIVRSPLSSAQAEVPEGSEKGTDDLAASLARVEQENKLLQERQTELASQLADLRIEADKLLHMIEYLQERQERTPVLPLPLARLASLILEPGPSIAHLREMVWLGRLTGTRLERDEQELWQPKVSPRRVAGNVARDFSRLVFGSFARRGVVYRVQPHHPAQPVRPRVLHVIPNVFVGGSTQLVVDLMERLGHRYEMQVVTAALPPHGRHENMTVHHIPLGSPAEAFTPMMKDFAPDLIHIHYWGESDRPWYQAALAAACETRAVLVENVNTPVEPLRHPRISSYLFVSQYIRDAFAPDIVNGRVIHPGIDLKRFAPSGFAPGAEDTIGMVYRLTRDKLDDNSIDPLIDVALARPRTRILVIGNGELLPVFAGRVRDAGVAHNFEFTGTVPFAALPDLYRQFSIFVAPVVRESFGQVTPFAMALGQAVAGFKVGALPEILGGTQTLGANREELAQILLDLLDAPERRAALGAANAARASQFAIENAIKAYAEAYGAALGHPADLMAGFPEAELFPEA